MNGDLISSYKITRYHMPLNFVLQSPKNSSKVCPILRQNASIISEMFNPQFDYWNLEAFSKSKRCTMAGPKLSVICLLVASENFQIVFTHSNQLWLF